MKLRRAKFAMLHPTPPPGPPHANLSCGLLYPDITIIRLSEPQFCVPHTQKSAQTFLFVCAARSSIFAPALGGVSAAARTKTHKYVKSY